MKHWPAVGGPYLHPQGILPVICWVKAACKAWASSEARTLLSKKFSIDLLEFISIHSDDQGRQPQVPVE
jgi:hypothetical protein